MHPTDAKKLAASISAGEDVAPKIYRSQVLNRAHTIHAIDSVPYDMGKLCEHGWRNDCSGKISEWFGIPASIGGSWGGVSTVTMLGLNVDGKHVALFRRIPASDLRPADVVAIAGPGTAGRFGHVRLFLGWVTQNMPNDNRYWALEQSGGMGPDRRMFDDLAEIGGAYASYRYVGIMDDQQTSPPALPGLPGGILRVGSTGDGVRTVQRALIRLGFNLGPYGPSRRGDDGIFGARTRAGLAELQRRAIEAGIDLGPTGADGVYGPFTRRALETILADPARIG